MEQLIVVFCIVLLGALAVGRIVAIIDNVKDIKAVKKEPCKQHDWVYNVKEQLMCADCGYTITGY